MITRASLISNPGVYREVAQLHVRHIGTGFLAKLGADVLEILYRSIAEARGSVLIVATEGGSVIGFVAGSGNMAFVYWRMLFRAPLLLARILPFLFSATILRRMFESLRYSLASPRGVDLPREELLSIAVAEEHRGSSTAAELYGALVDHFMNSGVRSFKIMVGEALLPAHKFYRRMGARAICDMEVHQGQRSVIYVQSIDPPHAR